MAVPFLMLHFCAQLFSFCFFTGEKDIILTSWDDTPVYYFAMHLCCRWTSEWRRCRQHSLFLLLFWNYAVLTLWVLKKDFLMWWITWPRTKSMLKKNILALLCLLQCPPTWKQVRSCPPAMPPSRYWGKSLSAGTCLPRVMVIFHPIYSNT